MQALDAVTLKHLAGEFRTALAGRPDEGKGGAKVSKVQHASKHEFVLTFWGGPQRAGNLLYINLSPAFAFCTLLNKRPDYLLGEFDKPTSLCMLLRKHLNGANVLNVHSLQGERVLNIVFENHNELGNKVRLVLSLELMGKHTNMLLYDDVQEVILGVAHGVSEQMSQYRELAAGLAYAPPPEPLDKRYLSETFEGMFVAEMSEIPPERWAQQVSDRYYGWGRQLLTGSIGSVASPEVLYRQLLQLEEGIDLHSGISPDRKAFTLLAPAGWRSEDSLNSLVSNYFGGEVRAQRKTTLRQRMSLSLSQRQKRLSQRQKEITPVDEAEISALQALGDRILAGVSMQELPASPTCGVLRLPDYDGVHELTIDIDPSQSWVENAQVYYRRAKKARARQEAFTAMSEQLNAEQAHYAELQWLVSQAETLAELRTLESELVHAGLLKAQMPVKKGEAPGKPDEMTGIERYTSSDGLTLLVGKSGEGNGKLVGKLARSDDIWLHVHQMPGSHVLIKAERQEIPDQTLLEAANLAVHFSSARQSLNVPVIYTESRYVRKIPGSYPGHVNYRQEETVFITPDLLLIERLSTAQERLMNAQTE